jgi:hypothetical protein
MDFVDGHRTGLAKRKHEEALAKRTRGEEIETMPLFLSDQYKELYDRSKEELEAMNKQVTSNNSREDKRKQSKNSKMYRA